MRSEASGGLSTASGSLQRQGLGCGVKEESAKNILPASSTVPRGHFPPCPRYQEHTHAVHSTRTLPTPSIVPEHFPPCPREQLSVWWRLTLLVNK